MMHHFPYMYVISERLRQQQIYEQQMRQNQSGKAANPAMDNRATELESLKKSGILNLLSVPEGRVKIQELAMRIQANKSKADQQVAGWSYEEKLNYFNSFADNHPVMEMLNDASNDPMQKIATFITMSDDDLEQMLKLQYIVAHEDGQSLIDGLRKRLLNNDDVNTETQKGSIVDGIITTIKSLSSMKVSNAGGQSTNQSHSHDHQHGHDHKHSASCGHRVNQPPPDVSKGEIEKIER